MARHLWVPAVVIGCYGVGRIWKDIPGHCFAFPVILGMVLTVLAARRGLASAGVGLVGLAAMAWVSSWPPAERRDDQALAPIVKFGLQCVIFWACLFVGLMMPLKTKASGGRQPPDSGDALPSESGG